MITDYELRITAEVADLWVASVPKLGGNVHSGPTWSTLAWLCRGRFDYELRITDYGGGGWIWCGASVPKLGKKVHIGAYMVDASVTLKGEV